MVGQWTATKPSRSDEVLDDYERAKIANQVRAQFDSIAPKRPTKPSRSESDSTSPLAPLSDENIPVPEFEKLRSLQSQSQAIFGDANAAQDEFVETQYYEQLDSVDKEHHTIEQTGTGFISVNSEGGGNGYDLQLESGTENGGQREMVFRTNPATNDWIPKIEDDREIFCSAKPNRSESG